MVDMSHMKNTHTTNIFSTAYEKSLSTLFLSMGIYDSLMKYSIVENIDKSITLKMCNIRWKEACSVHECHIGNQ